MEIKENKCTIGHMWCGEPVKVCNIGGELEVTRFERCRCIEKK